eukprot:NODE_541_length_6250_cov_0.390831.p1 type:complete len:611 gc:universal NODE_541_length_6250_cov_0.390831:2682-850(-)
MDYSQFGRIKTANKQASATSSDFGVSSRRSGKITTGRPTTALKGAGFQSQRQSRVSSPIKEIDPYSKLESDIQMILNELYISQDLKKAKTAYDLIQEMGKLKAPTNELILQVLLQLAIQYEYVHEYSESNSVYQDIVQNKYGPLPDRFLMNIGHNFYKMQDYLKSVKYYQMAHDKLQITEYKICCLKSIAQNRIHLNQLDKAIEDYQSVLSLKFDIQAAYELFICYSKTNAHAKIKSLFKEILVQTDPDLEFNRLLINKNDDLSDYCQSKCNQFEKLVLFAVKLQLSLIPNLDYLLLECLDGCIDIVKNSPHNYLTNALELLKCWQLLILKKSQDAIELYKSFELKEQRLKSAASINLSFIYLMQKDLQNAEKYCSMVLSKDKYNSKALVNMGCICYEKGELLKAMDYFQRALNSDALCIPALHNLAFTKQSEGFKWFEKLFQIHHLNHEAMYHLVKHCDPTKLKEYGNILLSLCPTDASILFDLGVKLNNVQMVLEAYRYDPCHIGVLNYLGEYYQEQALFEKSKHFYSILVDLQPSARYYYLYANSMKLCGHYLDAYHVAISGVENEESLELLELIYEMSVDLNLNVATWEQRLQQYGEQQKDSTVKN